jgi:hypothetical protein
MKNFKNLFNSIGYRRTTRNSISGREKSSLSLQNIETGSVVQPASYLMVTGSKMAGS